MKRWGPAVVVTAVALVGASTTLAGARFAGMKGGELVHLGQLLLPAIAATVVAVLLGAPLLSKATVASRFIALALIAAVVSLANLLVLSALMLVRHDVVVIAVLIGYSAAAGIGAAVALSRSFQLGFTKLLDGAERLGAGDLGSRVGQVQGGPELQRLAETLDAMAARLDKTIASEKRAKGVRDDLIVAVSHDLRTPLAGLRAMVEAIDDKVVDDPETFRRYIAEMRTSIEALAQLVDDLFELVQLDAAAIRTETDRTRLDEVVHSALAACGAQAAEKGVSVETRLNGTGGELISPRLSRVLQNLLQNAIRHTPSDGAVRIYSQAMADRIQFSVEDNGEGIPADALERVFEPFWRGDAARSQRGAGLGLALAKRIAEALGGDLTVESEPGNGARFALVVPRASALDGA